MKGRYYRVDGELYPSVTTVLSIIRKPGLEVWRGRLGNDEADRQKEAAARAGTAFHAAVEKFFDGEISSEHSAALSNLAAWLRFLQAEVVAREQVLVSKAFRFAGRMDMLVSTPSGLFILDFKYTDYLAAEYPLQLAAYIYAARENDMPVSGGYIVQVSKKNSKVTAHFYTGEFEWEVFKHLRHVFDYLAPTLITEIEIQDVGREDHADNGQQVVR